MRVEILCRNGLCDRLKECGKREVEIDKGVYLRGIQKASARGQRGMIQLDSCEKYGRFLGISFLLVKVNEIYTSSYIAYLNDKRGELSSKMEREEKVSERRVRALSAAIDKVDNALSRARTGEVLSSESGI